MRVQPQFTNYLIRLRGQMRRIKAYADRVVDQLASDGLLPPEAATDIDSVGYRRQKYHAAIAHALERHLASSGEFTYTLDLTRQDRNVDPVEDFLLNTKSGHCQRFATALVLMLRTQGIPAQMVVGYRGCTSHGDGSYEVRESNAHAWVEVLLPADSNSLPPVWTVASALGVVPGMQAVAMAGGSLALFALPSPANWQAMRWVTLDPTPSAPAEDSGAATLFEQARQKWGAVMKALLLAYNRDSREQAADAIKAWLVADSGWSYVTFGALAVAGTVVLRRRAVRRAAVLAGYPEYVRRLAALLATHGFEWRTGHTAREFAIQTEAGLRALPRGADIADIPVRLIGVYYAERFGGQQLTATDREEIDAFLKKLGSCLKAL
jgi:hypothetical protein